MSAATSPARPRRSWRQLAVIAAAIVALTLLALLVAAPPSVREDGPEGTLALRLLAERNGIDVIEDDAPVDGAPFVLAHDLRSEPDARRLLEWVRAGGVVVTAAPRSALADLVGVQASDRAGAAFTGSTTLTPACAVPEVAGVQRITVRVSDPLLDVEGALTCFPGGSGAPWLAVVSEGAGRVVVLASTTPLTNEFLPDTDNARLGLALLGDGPVVFGTPLPAASDQSLVDFLPDPALGIVAGLLTATVLYALARGRRLGMPAPEEAPTRVPASALVDATAALWRASGDVDHVAGVLRAATVDRLRCRLHLPADAPDRQVAQAVAIATGRDHDDVVRLLSARATDHDHLLSVAQDLRDLLADLEHTP